ncbi:hypothetical protein RHMOL_Rhmol01G0303800 [Rhododendron molle]|uniref:Uncharacterized protein n=1 Tax=Rhododendron molle TaxID=49168 RepID=A0ACC0Q6W9_RHOML|nr:hypothetical protein RHMOL_Rhmol01G0303800 [Rhododendron molle]
MAFPYRPYHLLSTENLWEKTLLGRFIDDRHFSESTIQQVVNSFWHTKGPVFVEKRSGVFCFHFEDQYDIECILAEQPWNVHGAVLVLQPWAPNTILPQLQFPAVDVWIQAHNIPIECYYSDLAHLLGSAAGHLLHVDWSDIRTRSLDFFRFKVRIHTDEPLIPGAFIELLEGDFHWIQFRYERIFKVCYKCGRIGHSNNTCNRSLVEALDSLHQRYNESPFSSTFPLILENNKPMFSPSLRALRNTDCNRTSRIWVLYEEEVQNMEMDQNLVFNVDISDSASSGEIFHTPEEDPFSPPAHNPQPSGEPVSTSAQSSSWWQAAISMFSPPFPNATPLPQQSTINLTTTPPQQTPSLFDQQLNYSHPPIQHAPTPPLPPLLPPTPPISLTEAVPTNITQNSPPVIPQDFPHATLNNESPVGLTPITIPPKVSEVFRCSAPDFFGDDSLAISDSHSLKSTQDVTGPPLSNVIKQQTSLSKKRSSSSSSDADSPRGGGGKHSKLVQLNQREQPPGLFGC